MVTGGADGVMTSLKIHEGTLALDAVRVKTKGVVVLSAQGAGG